MKKIFLILFCSGLSYLGYTQPAKEWVRQKQTQIEYLLDQIIGLRAYAGVVNKGFQTAKDGLSIINQIKQGDFSIHDNHFQSLRAVSPVIASSPDLKKAAIKSKDIHFTMQRIQKLCNLENGLTASEKVYVKAILADVKGLSENTMVDFEQLVESGHLSLSDDERLKQVAIKRAELQDQHLFLQSLEKRVKLLAISRVKEKKDINILNKLYGIE